MLRYTTAKEGRHPITIAAKSSLLSTGSWELNAVAVGVERFQASELMKFLNKGHIGGREDIPIAVSIIAHSASHELLGVLSLRDLTPICTTLTMAVMIQMMPTQKMPPMLCFWARGIWRFHIIRIGRIMTVRNLLVDRGFRTGQECKKYS